MIATSKGRARLRIALLVTLGLATALHDRLWGGFAPVFFGVTPRPLVDGLRFEARAYVGFHGPRWTWVWGDGRVSLSGVVLAPVPRHDALEWWPTGTSLPVWRGTMGTEPELLAAPLDPPTKGLAEPIICRVDELRVRTRLGVVRRLRPLSIPIVRTRFPPESNQAVALERAVEAIVPPADEAWVGWRSKLDDPAGRAAILAENAEALAWWDRVRSLDRFERGGAGFGWDRVRGVRRLSALIAARARERSPSGDAIVPAADEFEMLRLATRILEDRDEVTPDDLLETLAILRRFLEPLRLRLTTSALDESGRGQLAHRVAELERAIGPFDDARALTAFYEARYARALAPLAEVDPIAPLLDAGGRMLGWAARRWSLDGDGPARKSAVLRRAPWAIAANQWAGLLAFSAASSCTDLIQTELTGVRSLLLDLRMMRVAVALRSFEADAGRWPADVAELGATVPGGLRRDPLADGALLRYRVIGEQAVVWSVAAGDDWEPPLTPGRNEWFAWRFEPATELG